MAITNHERVGKAMNLLGLGSLLSSSVSSRTSMQAGRWPKRDAFRAKIACWRTKTRRVGRHSAAQAHVGGVE